MIIFILLAAISCAFTVIFLYGVYDWFGFGGLSGMSYGSSNQEIGWVNVPLWKQSAYRISQVILYAIVSWVWIRFAGDFGWAVALGSLSGIPFMLHDLSFHIAGGHLLPTAGWNPFSMKEKRKPFSLHYWPIRFWVSRQEKYQDDYPVGVPYRFETFGRLAGIPVVIIVTIVTYLVV